MIDNHLAHFVYRIQPGFDFARGVEHGPEVLTHGSAKLYIDWRESPEVQHGVDDTTGAKEGFYVGHFASESCAHRLLVECGWPIVAAMEGHHYLAGVLPEFGV